jgi:hypothetical protein
MTKQAAYTLAGIKLADALRCFKKAKAKKASKKTSKIFLTAAVKPVVAALKTYGFAKYIIPYGRVTITGDMQGTGVLVW